MHIAAKIAIGAGIVGAGALLLSACSTEKDPDSFALDEFGDFDRAPTDNRWTPNELTQSYQRTSTREVNTYRAGDYIFGTREILRTSTQESMARIFAAAKGNDAVLSLQELRDFTMRYDKNDNGTLSGGERGDFKDDYGITRRSQTSIIGREPFSRYSPRNDYPDPSYPNPNYPGNGNTGPGDDGGSGGSGGTTGPGDDGGSGSVPTYPGPGNGGNGNGPGDDGGGSGNPGNGSGNGNGNGNGNSSGNGNPNPGDF